MKYFRIILIFSLLCNIILFGGYIYYLHGNGKFPFKTIPAYKVNLIYPEYVNQTSLFSSLPLNNSDIVFLGDSITGFSRWEEEFNNKNIINRGIGSDTTEGVLNRLSQITKYHPSKIFLMVGVNDFNLNRTVGDTLKSYKTIVETIQKDSPSTIIYIQSVLPVNKTIGKSINAKNESIVALNMDLSKLDGQKNVTYVDVYTSLVKDNQLPSKYTADGIHLNGEGYAIWKKVIEKYIS